MSARGRVGSKLGAVVGAVVGTVVIAGAIVIATLAWANARDGEPLALVDAAAEAPADPAQVARGAYLALAGNCAGCHTAPGGLAYAGGRGIPTPFGSLYAPNLTPDPVTGLGRWSTAAFWRALHHGRSRDGRLLYPAFPYPNYTRIDRGDSDAIHAYLRSLPAVVQPNRANTLRFPFDRPSALAVWRALYFRPGDPQSTSDTDRPRSAEWTRGAYLVEGLGHCNACHASRNALGATRSTLDLAGGLIPVQNWYAPSLTSSAEAGLAHWSAAEIVGLLGTGVSAQGAVSGPMAEVVGNSTQHLTEADLQAIATYLQALPQSAPSGPPPAPLVNNPSPDGPGARLYDDHCAGCHGDHGQGVPYAYPALAGNRMVTLPTPANLVHIVLEGGFPPSTAGNPRPFGMPPFATVLSAAEVAQVLSHVRGSWGNRAAALSSTDVDRFRANGP